MDLFLVAGLSRASLPNTLREPIRDIAFPTDPFVQTGVSFAYGPDDRFHFRAGPIVTVSNNEEAGIYGVGAFYGNAFRLPAAFRLSIDFIYQRKLGGARPDIRNALGGSLTLLYEGTQGLYFGATTGFLGHLGNTNKDLAFIGPVVVKRY